MRLFNYNWTVWYGNLQHLMKKLRNCRIFSDYHALMMRKLGWHGWPFLTPVLIIKRKYLRELVTCELNHDLARAALEIAGPAGWLARTDADAPDGGLWPLDFMFALGLVIGGGTAQVQKNIIAERGLGLPREPQPA
jgi:hypothetical protein